ncbi:MAG: hypothetical protein ACRC48_06880 [Aeromonas veronii]
MSLESQVAALVEATNKLTNTVSNKISDINNTVANKLKEVDAAVSKVAADIQATIRGELRKVVFVDQIAGSDSNDGKSKAKAFATLSKAANACLPGGVLEIQIVGDYTYSDTDAVPSFYAASVMIRSYDLNNKGRIKFSYMYNALYPDQFFMRSFTVYHSATIEFYGINLELPDVPPEHGSGFRYPHGAAVVRTNSSSLVAIDLTVRLSQVEVIVPEPARSGWHLVGNPSGYSNIILDNIALPAEWRDRNKIYLYCKLASTSITLANCNHKNALSTDESVYNDGRDG